jgi:hypothetical protein
LNSINKTLELVKPEFISKAYENQFIPKSPIFRFNYNSSRFYYQFDEADEPIFYPSVTSILSDVVPESEFLKMKRMELGYDYNKWMGELAHQGTFIHKIISDYLISNSFDFSTLNQSVYEYFRENKRNYEVDTWLYAIRPKIASLIKFCIESKIEPIAIESIVTYKDDKYKYAGAVDIIAYATVEERGYFGEFFKSGERAGQPKETKSIFRKLVAIDIKSGTSGFYESNALQLKMYEKAINQTFGLELQGLINVQPVKWNNGNEPNYKQEDQINNVDLHYLDNLLSIYFKNYEDPEQIAIFEGKLTKEDNIFKNIFEYVNVKEYVKKLTKTQNYLNQKGAA